MLVFHPDVNLTNITLCDDSFMKRSISADGKRDISLNSRSRIFIIEKLENPFGNTALKDSTVTFIILNCICR